MPRAFLIALTLAAVGAPHRTAAQQLTALRTGLVPGVRTEGSVGALGAVTSDPVDRGATDWGFTPERANFVGVGAAVGLVTFAVLTIRGSRNGALGYAGAILLLPIALPVGAVVGGLAGYVVSLAVYPP